MESEAFHNRHPGLDPGSSAIHLTIITTGGTIDGADSDKGTLRPTSDAVKWLLDRTEVKVTHIPLFNKDSREITVEDRRLLLEAIEEGSSDVFLITHGTFTICETGRFLKRNIKAAARTILLTGAWKPFGQPNSDAPAQMAFALKVLDIAPPGIFIAMDGKLRNPDITEKDEIEPGVYALVDDYGAPEHLIVRDEAHLRELILEGLNSGPATPMTDQDWADIRQRVREHAAERRRRAI